MESEAARAHHALVSTQRKIYAEFDDASFEPRSDLIVALCPSFPIPQCNGPWVVKDSPAAVAALPDAIAEVEAAGAWPWVQTRSAHERVRQAALELGLTHVERIPGMVVRPGELVETAIDVEIGPVGPDDVEATNDLLAVSFEAPREIFDRFPAVYAALHDASWYAGRVDGRVVSTAGSFTVDGVTGVFNVATPPDHRGRGYGAALTAHAVRAGFDAGADLAYLQSSVAGHGVYRRLGFRDVEEYILLARPPDC